MLQNYILTYSYILTNLNFKIRRLFTEDHFLKALSKGNSSTFLLSREILNNLSHLLTCNLFLRQVLMRFCLLNPRSQSTVLTGATNNLSAASATAGYTSFFLMARLAESLELPTFYSHCLQGTA
ncbi:hypothetical protein DPMN_148915 [Dreissena polymorpha]|uniref:Uncharacterized protein n=1 Tax=Dreissena polymorpha TaxID=45954 RepID=A0A9D4J1Z8_DREPO|nr:hypothetical protein DPMN_148915 [Dreissena polymorpha]